MQEIADEELDAYILTRLRMLGVDLNVLPREDREAPADQKRILESARRFLRSTPAAIVGTGLDSDGDMPVLYPSALADLLKGAE